MSEATTPPTKRGVIRENEKNEPLLTALIDWCQLTVKEISPDSIADDILCIPYNLMRNDLRGGVNGYKSLMCFDDIRVLESPDAKNEEGDYVKHYQILMSGSGCRNFEKFLEARSETWFEFFERCVSHEVNFTRIDLAIDDKKTYFTIQKLIKLAEKGLVVSRLKQFVKYGSFRIKGGEKKGQTINFGSRSSEFFMTLYEKNYEQAEKFGLSEDEMEEKWNRYELKFRQKRANSLVEELIKRREVFSIAMEVLNESIRFVKKPIDTKIKDVKKYPLWKPWAWFMVDVKKLNLCMQPESKNYFDKLHWIKKYVAPTLKILREVDNRRGTAELENIIENAELNKHHMQLLEDCLQQIDMYEQSGIML